MADELDDVPKGLFEIDAPERGILVLYPDYRPAEELRDLIATRELRTILNQPNGPPPDDLAIQLVQVYLEDGRTGQLAHFPERSIDSAQEINREATMMASRGRNELRYIYGVAVLAIGMRFD